MTINDDNIIIINVNMNNVMKQLKSDNHCMFYSKRLGLAFIFCVEWYKKDI